MEKLPPSSKRIIEFCESSAEGRKMLAKVCKATNTKIAYSMGCKFLSDYLNKTLSEIVSEYKVDVKKSQYEAFDKWEMIFDDFAIYLRDKLGYKSASVHLFHVGAKALINANVPRSLRLQAKTPEVHSDEIPPITFEDLKSVYEMCNVRERAFIAFLKDSGISSSDAVRLNIGDLKGFDKNKSWIHIRLIRKKEYVNYETFLGPNATAALRAYLKFRERRGEKITKETPIFTTETKPYKRLNAHALHTAFRRIKQKSGITISTHRLRKFFETYMALGVRHPIVLKYWMGHKIKSGRDIEAKYVIPPTPEQLKLYKEAYEHIDFNPKPDAFELAVAETKVRTEGMTPEQKRQFIKRLSLRHPKFLEHPDIKRILEKSTKGGGLAIEPAFKEISEDQLLAYLTNGWKIEYKTSNGTVIVKR